VRDPRIASVVAGVMARFPGTRVEFVANPDPATWNDIPDAMCVLHVPDERRREVHGFAQDLAYAVFGDDPLPMFIWEFGPDESSRFSARTSSDAAGVSDR